MKYIDRKTFMSLKEMVGEDSKEVLLEIIDTYIKDSQILKEKIVQGIKNEDYQKVEDMAHGLKSSSRLIGAFNLSQMAFQLEMIAKSKALPKLDVIQEITKEHQKVIIELEKEKVKLQNELF